MIDVDDLQRRHGDWCHKNFGESDRSILHCALGVCEEAGELAHSILKADQGIRGDQAEHDLAARDACGDIVMYLLDLCARKGWSLESILHTVEAEVHARDWKKDPEGGGIEVSRFWEGDEDPLPEFPMPAEGDVE